jgi:hypothetical protein
MRFLVRIIRNFRACIFLMGHLVKRDTCLSRPQAKRVGGAPAITHCTEHFDLTLGKQEISDHLPTPTSTAPTRTHFGLQPSRHPAKRCPNLRYSILSVGPCFLGLIIATMSSTIKPYPKKRRSAPKVRTGCGTCR